MMAQVLKEEGGFGDKQRAKRRKGRVLDDWDRQLRRRNMKLRAFKS